MGLKNLFKPAWMSERESKALRAVEKESEQAKLMDIIRNAPLANVRIAAVGKITGRSALIDIVKGNSYMKVSFFALEKLTDQSSLKDLVLSKKCPCEIRRSALDKITDQSLLADIVAIGTFDNPDLQKSALNKINDPGILSDVAKNGANLRLCITAIEKLDDKRVQQEMYAYIAKNNIYGQDAPKVIVERLTAQDILADVALNARNGLVGCLAIEKLTDQRLLAGIIVNPETNREKREKAFANLTDQGILEELAQNTADEYLRRDAADKLTDKELAQEVYKSIAQNSTTSGFLRKTTVDKLNDKSFAQKVYADIVENEEDSFTRKYAMGDLTNPNELVKIAKSASDKYKYNHYYLENCGNFDKRHDYESDFRIEAIDKITDDALLSDIAENAASSNAREAAKKKLNLSLSGKE